MNVMGFLIFGYIAFAVFGYNQMKRGTKTPVEEYSFVDASSDVIEYHQGKKLFKWTLISAVIAFLGFMPLMGIPGALIMELADLLGWGPKESLGDNTWPLAILMTVILPLIIPICIFTAQKMMLAGYGSMKGIISFAMPIAWLMLFILWFRSQG